MQRHWFKLRKKHITLFYIIGYFYMLHVVVYYNVRHTKKTGKESTTENKDK
jgi:CHASE3 domain sensor protein